MSLLQLHRIPGIAALANPGFIVAQGANPVTSIKMNLVAAVDPAVGNDNTQGYGVASLWINTVAQTSWICIDTSTGAAIWKQTGASSASGVANKETITIANTFATGDIIRRTNGNYAKAKADSAANGEVLGVVETASGAAFTVVYSGKVNVPSHGFTIGDGLFLSAGTAGLLTATDPTTAGQISKPVALVLDANNLLVINFRGKVIDAVLTPLTYPNVCQGRLTPTTGVPISGDVSGATSLYFTPYLGNQIALFNGISTWTIFTFTEKTLPLAGFAANSVFDVFAYNNAGTLAVEALVWTNITTRATALVLQDGISVKSGDSTRRFIGTIATNGSVGQCDWIPSSRCIWNMYNRMWTNLVSPNENTSSWTYAFATWRQARATAANKFTVVIGLPETLLDATVQGSASSAANNVLTGLAFGVGINSTTVNSAQKVGGVCDTGSNISLSRIDGKYTGILPIGLNSINWLEYGAASIATFYSANGPMMAGLMGELWM